MWDGLHGSRDWRAVVEAGQQLRNALLTARQTWREDRDRHGAAIAELEAERDAALDQAASVDDETASLAEVVRSRHEREHPDAWLVCPDIVCRALEFPAADPSASLLLRSLAGADR